MSYKANAVVLFVLLGAFATGERPEPQIITNYGDSDITEEPYWSTIDPEISDDINLTTVRAMGYFLSTQLISRKPLFSSITFVGSVRVVNHTCDFYFSHN